MIAKSSSLFRHFRSSAAAVLAGLVFGCGPDLPPLQPVAHPDLANVETRARQQIEEARDRLETAERRGDVERLAEAYGSMGELYQAYGLLDSAAASYENAAALDPNGLVWAYLQGVVAQEEGDFPAARAHFERALELAPRNQPAALRLAEVLLAQGESEMAEERTSTLAGGEEYAAALAYLRGRSAASRGEHEAAVDQFRAALAAQPGAGPVHHALSQSLLRLGRTEEAQVEMAAVSGGGEITFPDPLVERVGQLAEGPSTYLKRGNRAMVAGNLEEAETLFREGLRQDPEHLELRLNLGLLKARQGDLQAALSELVSASKIDPENAQAHHDVGTTRLALGQAEAAVESLRRALELEPDYQSAHFNLANALGILERWSEVEEAVAAVLEHEPDHPRARYLQAMAWHQKDDSTRARTELEALVAGDPDNRVFREGLVRVLAESRQRAKAAEVAIEGVERESSSVEERVALARTSAHLLWRSGQRRPAIQLWQRVTELAPESSQAFTDLGNAQQLGGQRRQAAESFAEAVRLDPANLTAWLSETRLWILLGEFATAHERLLLAVERHPGDPALANTFARLLSTAPDARLRDGDRAIQMARLAYGAEPSLEHAETVPMALAEAGRFEQAIQFQRGLAQKAQMSGDRAALTRLMRNLKLYEARKPVRIEDPGAGK